MAARAKGPVGRAAWPFARRSRNRRRRARIQGRAARGSCLATPLGITSIAIRGSPEIRVTVEVLPVELVALEDAIGVLDRLATVGKSQTGTPIEALVFEK